MNILAWDIENSPILAYTWGLWDQNIGLEQIVKPMETMCFAAKWVGDTRMFFRSTYHDGKEEMLKEAHRLLDEADAVISWNGIKHDGPHLRKEFLMQGLLPPSPYKDIDLLTTSRKQFKFDSNKLDWVARELGVGKKVEHEGFGLWLKCMAGDERAWARMRTYNRNDVMLTEGVYNHFRPWIKSHPSYGAFTGTDVCTNCGSDKLQHRGTAYTTAASYPRVVCLDCGKWGRTNKRIAGSAVMGLNS